MIVVCHPSLFVVRNSWLTLLRQLGIISRWMRMLCLLCRVACSVVVVRWYVHPSVCGMHTVALAWMSFCCGWLVAVLWGGGGGFCGGVGWSVFLFSPGVGSLRGSLVWVLWDGVRVWRFSWWGSGAAFYGVFAGCWSQWNFSSFLIGFKVEWKSIFKGFPPVFCWVPSRYFCGFSPFLGSAVKLTFLVVFHRFYAWLRIVLCFSIFYLVGIHFFASCCAS